ncbi:MAG TPA: YCF48-related protein [Bryobacteraceae bacterium]|nr:YCF48-related protein [Bryobacteraceae bacterium]
MINRFSFLALCGVAGAALAAAVVGGSVPTDDWKLSGPFGGTATTVAVNPKNTNTVLAGGMSSLLYQSDDAGDSWKLLDFPKRTLSEVTSILIDPANTDHYLVGLLAAEDAGLFESFDRGSSWQPVKDVSGFGVRALAAAPSDPSHFVAGTQRGVMLSTDSGKTWTRISDSANLEMTSITEVAVDPKDPNIIFAGTSHLPWRTRDGGKTWDSIHTGMIDDSDVFSIYVDPRSPEKVFASACSGIYASDDRGDLWHKLMGIPNTSRRTHVVRFEPGTCCGDPNTPGAVYAGTTTGLFRSLNDGKTWNTLTDTQVNSLAFDPSQISTVYLALEHEGVGKSRNGGQNIDLVNNGFVDRVISSIAVSGKKIVAIEPQDGETSGVFTSNDQGQSWSQIRNLKGIAGIHLTSITGSFSEDRILIAASSHQLYKSIDAGMSWKPVPIRIVTQPPPPVPEKTPAKPVRGKTTTSRARTSHPVKPKPLVRELAPSDVYGLYSVRNGAKEAVFAATDLGLVKSEDMAESWSECQLPGATAVTALYFSPAFNGNLVARTSSGLYATKDFGEHWASVTFPLPASDIYDVALPPDSSAPWLVATRVGLYSSLDGGATWYANTGGIPASTVSTVVYRAPMVAYAVEYGRLYESSDGNKSWKEIPTALHSRIRRLWTPELNSEHLYGITGDLGIIFRN